MQLFTSKFSVFKKAVLLMLLAECFSFTAMANPGDTTWVTIFNLRKLTYHGAYDTTATFPTNKRFRKIRMHYILGRYACPPGTQYCGSWDYTTEVRAWPAGKDSVEIARIITPYATDWYSQNKKHDYIVDVTDYATALQGVTAMRYYYDGWSWGFTLTLKLEMIEGVPPHDALSVRNVYDGYFTFGAASTSTNYIENYLSPKTFSYGATTGQSVIKNTVTGHGADNVNCAEFCSKYYQLYLNNNLVNQHQLWRPTCGINEIYPQTGTWIYERANWCPGEWVRPIYHNITPLTSPNTNFTVNVDMEPYTTVNPSAGFNWVSQLINYSTPNYSLDVSIEDIISPTKDDNYLRENPTCASPTIKVKNVGSQTVTSVVFNYGLHGQAPMTYTWIPDSAFQFLDENIVVLPSASAILSSTVSNLQFDVSVASVNGVTDQNQFNDIYSAIIPTVTIFKTNFIVRTTATSNAGETTFNIFDENGGLLYTGGGQAGDDTLSLDPGCYRISIDDTGCDGLSFLGTATGTMKLYNMNGVSSFYTFSGDFGCNYTKYFIVPADIATGIQKNTANANRVGVFPNPASNTANLRFNLGSSQNVSYKIMDISGRVMQQKSLGKVLSMNETVDVSQLTDGVYMIFIELDNNSTVSKKLVIQR